MRRLTLPFLTLLLAAPAFADTQDGRLHQIEHFFADANIVEGPSIVECKLSRGTQTECFSITVKAEPTTYTPGPWCPTSIEENAEMGGIWLQDGVAHDVDGNFIADLAKFYGDDTWQLFDAETGKIRVTDTKASCEAAARPDVDPEFNNYCVQCELEYMPADATMTYIIPLEPQHTWRTNSTRGASGVANNGIRLDGPAPVDAILAAHTLAPFDDCGGHVNTHVGYHYHAVTDCLNDAVIHGDDAPQIGIAMDGYPILSHLLIDGTAPSDLDKCNGHESKDGAYHYHAGEAGSNAILSCLHAEVGCSSEDPELICDATARPARP
jgi:hypothetical protein